MNQVCSHCGKPYLPGFNFCCSCGEGGDIYGGPDNAKPYSELMGPDGHAIRAINGEQAGQFYRMSNVCTIGRSEVAEILLDYDRTVSPMHARLTANGDEMLLEDIGALNGIFVKAHERVELKNNDIIRAGNHFFLFEVFMPEPLDEDLDTEFYASPSRGETFRLIEVLRGGRRGRACMALENSMTVGRVVGDFIFPEDPYMSDRHFTVRWTMQGCVLLDHSLNGTYVQIHDPTRLTIGDLFFVGMTLFRIY